jgi:hypothetical protein
MEAFDRLRGRLENNHQLYNRNEDEQNASLSESALRFTPKPKTLPNVILEAGPEQSRSNTWPVELKTPRYGLDVLVYCTTFGKERKYSSAPLCSLHCWTFISSGLMDLAGGELVLVLLRRDDESSAAYPLDFLRICDRAYEEAKRNQKKLQRWQTLGFEGPLFGRHDFHTAVLGFRNITPGVIEGDEIKKTATLKPERPYFHVLLLTDEELAIANKHGLMRALVIRDRHSAWFPCVPYVDRDKMSNVTLAAMEGSALARTPENQFEVSGLNVVQHKQDIYLLVPPSQAERFKGSIPFRGTVEPHLLRMESDIHEACDSVIYSGRTGTDSETLCAKYQDPGLTAMNFLVICTKRPTGSIMIVADGCLS